MTQRPHSHPTNPLDFKTADPDASWAVLDARGHLIAGQNAYTRQDPASTTKMATLYTILHMVEKGELPRNFLSRHRHDIDRMCIRSDNAAANRLAIAASGSVRKFCRTMTALMHEEGLSLTEFINPSGWPMEGHYSCAADMARIAYIFERDFPEHTHLLGRDHVRGVGRNTGADIIGEYCEFGKTGTGTGVYGTPSRKSFVGGGADGSFAIASARGPQGRRDFAEAASNYLGDGDRSPAPSIIRTLDRDSTPARPNTLPAARQFEYEVERGDSLVYLAASFGRTVDGIRRANNLRDGTIQVGQKLIIPDIGEIRVDRGQTLTGIARNIAAADGEGGINTQEVIALIRRINPDLPDSGELRIGQELVVPSDVRAAAAIVETIERRGTQLT